MFSSEFFFFSNAISASPGDAIVGTPSSARVILITAFRPIPPATHNGSMQVAIKMKQELSVHGIRVEICELPVSYQRSVPAAEECLSKMSSPPTQVLSLGELGDCETRLETMARNRDLDRAADEDGVRRTMEVIDPSGSLHVPFDTKVADMYCSLEEKNRRDITVSHDAGGFICNHLSYVFGQKVQARGIPFSFAHVPNNSCRRQILKTGNLFSRMLSATLGRESAMARTQRLCCERLPTLPSQIDNMIETIQPDLREEELRCHRDFLSRLRGSMAQER